MTEKLIIKEAIIVEGRYDKIKLSGFISSPIIETGGFRVFSDKEKQQLIRAVAERRGILVMTDADSAGFVIRNFLRGIVPSDQIKHAYIPTVDGKERRKSEPSKEGTLGVEGISTEALRESILKSGATIVGEGLAPPVEEQSDADTKERLALVKGAPAGAGEGLHDLTDRRENPDNSTITKLDFFEYGLTGSDNSSEHRAKILESLGLPKYMTTNAMISALNCLFTKEEFESFLSDIHLDNDSKT